VEDLMARRKKSRRGKPWPRTLINGTVRWYLPKSLTGGRLVALRRADGSFVDGPDAGEEALALAGQHAEYVRAGQKGEDNYVGVVLLKHLDYLQERGITPGHYQNTRRYYQEFDARWPELLIRDLRVEHFRTWFAEQTTWSSSTRRQVGITFKAAFRWASGVEGSRLIPQNPLEGWRLPSPRSRGAETLVSEEDHQTLLGAVAEDMRDVLTVLREVGTRPVNLWRTTAGDVDHETRALVLKVHKTADETGQPLVVPLTPEAYAVCQRLAEKYPEGPIFRTVFGNEWDAGNFSTRLAYFTKKLKLKVTAYGYRHTVATELLARGTPDAQVAAILGHTGTAMLYKHYGHLSVKVDQLRGHLVGMRGGQAGSAGSGTAPTPGGGDVPSSPPPPAG
jgi:integrase